APPHPLSPLIISTSSTVLTSSTISSSHALISSSSLPPPLLHEDVDSSSAVNINESNSILYLIDASLLVLDIFIFSHSWSLIND
ncbi:13136_t:CDS:1, partial [Entrophospora sp. SA101]